MSQKSWYKLFQNDNHVNNFTPTTIMHIGEQLYAFVINNVKICNGNMKFYVSSNLIYNNSSDVETDLPTGKSFARFDIDVVSEKGYGFIAVNREEKDDFVHFVEGNAAGIEPEHGDGEDIFVHVLDRL